ncbi:MAG: GIY-YIG nuclease family protein [Bauldia litoralis]|uniref:GIY-YIG nuclease family protein n=2 Tax=Bauldia litoralis TaxID=665467 RepID=UPI003299B922
MTIRQDAAVKAIMEATGLPRQFVKIGMTRNVGMRLATLQAASPFELVLLASEPGYVQREAELHAMFADLRVRGEWFRHEGRLASYITSLSSAEPPE